MTGTMPTEADQQHIIDALRRELEARTAELVEARAEQAATSEVLKIVSSSRGELAPIFEAILKNAVRICEAKFGHLVLVDGDLFRVAAEADMPKDLAEFFSRGPFEPTPGSHLDRVRRTKRVSHTADDSAEPVQGISSRYGGARSILAVPMLQKDTLGGVILIYRQEVRPFTDQQIELLENFADQAVIAIENARLFDEVQTKTHDIEEALKYQTGSANILNVIASSPTDVQPVLKSIVESACELCEAYDAVALLKEGDHLLFSAHHGPIPMSFAKWPINRQWTAGRAFIDKTPVHVHDLLAEQQEFPDGLELAKSMGHRSIVSVPLLREGESIGALVLRRTEVNPFTDKQIALLQTFADQAVIAIGNVRLFDEVQAKTHDLEEALKYQTGSANILSVIASSPTDVEPALKAIVESACKLCDAYDANVLLKFGDDLHFSAHHGPIPSGRDKRPINRNWTVGRAVLDKKPMQVSDFLGPQADEFPEGKEMALQQGHRCTLAVPLLREGEAIGAIALRRTEPIAFSDKQIALLQTFADQAVIAIGNVRLFDEVQTKTHDLEEALKYQTGSANILNVIAASPTDVQPVLKAIVESACELCDAYDAAVILRDGQDLQLSAHHGPIPMHRQHWPNDRTSLSGRAIADRRPVHIHDVLSGEGLDFAIAQQMSRIDGCRTLLSAPLLREGEAVGTIVLRRVDVHPFSDKQVALLQTFADQAVIALGNTRLFEEVQAKTHGLEEALTYQTGSSNILRVIASSPTDVKPVLQAIVESACELCGAYDALVRLKDGDGLAFGAHYGPLPVSLESVPFSANSTAGLAMIERKPVHVHDLLSSDGDRFPHARELARSHGERTILSVPLLREGESIGAIILRRTEVHPFSDKQIALLQTFADQAVIALGNVRLFEEVQARTRELAETLEYQTATSDVLNVISRSPNDLRPVMDTIVQTAQRLCASEYALILQRDGEGFFRIIGHANARGEFLDWLQTNPVTAGDGTAAGIAAAERKTVHLPDALADPRFTDFRRQQRSRARSMLAVPLMRDAEVIGVIFLARTEVLPFTDKQVELVTSFADQAVIAIENVRLFDEVQARTRDLQESLQQQTATADVLKVISRSAFDLQVVLDTLVESAARLCEADMSVITRQRGDTYFRAGSWGFPSEFMDYVKDLPIKPERATITGRTLLEGKVTHVHDVYTDPDYSFPEAQRLSGDPRTILGVPLLREGKPVGALALLRKNVRPFTDKQIELVTTFADQAVIAIENVRLFDEVQARTRELAQSLDNLRTAQDRLVQTEKLASLGQLTAGIAHEIKNPLNFVNNFAALSVELTDELNDVLKQAAIADKLRAEVDELTGFLKDNLAKVVQHGKRADSIVKNMLLHSREGSGEHRPADINALVDESLNLAYHGARAEKPQFNVTLQRNFDPEAGMVDVFPQEITRVFLNLLSNGFYAVTKRKADDGAGFEPVVSAMTKGRIDGVEIRIRDNGTGVPPEVKEKMFNPFFTTKPAGEGTGLGLSMSYDIIVKQHGGTIDVDTLPGEFTEFTIVLPRTSLSKKN
jgi:GAF domain-containing protein